MTARRLATEPSNHPIDADVSFRELKNVLDDIDVSLAMASLYGIVDLVDMAHSDRRGAEFDRRVALALSRAMGRELDTVSEALNAGRAICGIQERVERSARGAEPGW